MACRPGQYRKRTGIATSSETPCDGSELPPLAACRLPAAFSQRFYLLKLASHWGHLNVPLLSSLSSCCARPHSPVHPPLQAAAELPHSSKPRPATLRGLLLPFLRQLVASRTKPVVGPLSNRGYRLMRTASQFRLFLLFGFLELLLVLAFG